MGRWRRFGNGWRAGPLVVLTGALTLAACSAPSPSASTSSTSVPSVQANVDATGIPPFYAPPRPLPTAPAGTIIRSELVTGVPGVPAGAAVWRVLYHSRSIYDDDIAVSGYVIVPGGKAPPGGFPILTWAHGTTGFAGICAPSLFTRQGGVGPYLLPGLASYLRAGFVVAATDYQGLGTPGVHPYLLGESEGRGVLDAARAARHLAGVPTSDTVVIYGHSQGGHAALFAGEMAPTYAPDLHVVGVVAAAPATGLSTIIFAVLRSKSRAVRRAVPKRPTLMMIRIIMGITSYWRYDTFVFRRSCSATATRYGLGSNHPSAGPCTSPDKLS